MVSGAHNTCAIFRLLSDFRFFYENLYHWPPFSGVVLDLSYANRVNLIDYVKHAYDVLTSNGISISLTSPSLHLTESEKITPIYLCCAHFMKMVCKDLEKATSMNVSFYKDVIASMF